MDTLGVSTSGLMGSTGSLQRLLLDRATVRGNVKELQKQQSLATTLCFFFPPH